MKNNKDSTSFKNLSLNSAKLLTIFCTFNGIPLNQKPSAEKITDYRVKSKSGALNHILSSIIEEDTSYGNNYTKCHDKKHDKYSGAEGPVGGSYSKEYSKDVNCPKPGK